jgi:hypothetical protein
MDTNNIPQPKTFSYDVPAKPMIRLLVGGVVCVIVFFAAKAAGLERSVVGITGAFALMSVPLMIVSAVFLIKRSVNPGILELAPDAISVPNLFGSKRIAYSDIEATEEVATPKSGAFLKVLGKDGQVLLFIGEGMLADGASYAAIKKFLANVAVQRR